MNAKNLPVLGALRIEQMVNVFFERRGVLAADGPVGLRLERHRRAG